mmetsp:Transcript_15910/g.49336  ORF Transcript_15910/g.49336 Transcript_15910/m.49336 type:complete len:219 (+) Transcript_15910:734-1390(+)
MCDRTPSSTTNVCASRPNSASGCSAANHPACSVSAAGLPADPASCTRHDPAAAAPPTWTSASPVSARSRSRNRAAFISGCSARDAAFHDSVTTSPTKLCTAAPVVAANSCTRSVNAHVASATRVRHGAGAAVSGWATAKWTMAAAEVAEVETLGGSAPTLTAGGLSSRPNDRECRDEATDLEHVEPLMLGRRSTPSPDAASSASMSLSASLAAEPGLL